MKLPPLAVLAGGMATRLGDVAKSTPKALVMVAGRPFLDWQLEHWAREGIRHVVLCIGHMGSQIEEFAGNGARWGLKIDYSFDGPVLLGTGGALKQALPKISAPEFFVTYADSYLRVSFREVFQALQAPHTSGVMTVLENANQWDKSNTIFSNSRVLKYDKVAPTAEMRFIDYGLSLVKTAVFDEFPAGRAFDYGEVFQKIISRGEMAGVVARERFFEIGNPKGLAETEAFFLGR